MVYSSKKQDDLVPSLFKPREAAILFSFGQKRSVYNRKNYYCINSKSMSKFSLSPLKYYVSVFCVGFTLQLTVALAFNYLEAKKIINLYITTFIMTLVFFIYDIFKPIPKKVD